jgi:BirA family biotin operon repressor/biotin-[acetyl-CoA-carboxylase] ligase
MTREMNFKILRFDSIDSTNIEAVRQAKIGASEGLCIVAREQTRGRGRLDRSWQSPRDAGLYLSIVLRPRLEMKAWPLITLMAALAVSDTLRLLYRLAPDIKWPNDVCLGDRKLCGILAETFETEAGSACVLGIGINLRAVAVPPELEASATSVESAAQIVPDAEAMLQALLRQLATRYEQLQEMDGVPVVLRDWMAASSYARGKYVRVDAGAEVFAGVTLGLEDDGALRVEVANGEIKVVRAGDVRSVRSKDQQAEGLEAEKSQENSQDVQSSARTITDA